MKQYTTLVKEKLSEYTGSLRKRKQLTQEEMAEQLHITSRAYGDLERGKFCFSAVTLLFLMLIDDDSQGTLLDTFREKVHTLEE